MRRAAILVAALILAVSATPSAAHHGGRDIGSLLACERPNVIPPRCTSVGDNFQHYVYFDPSLTEPLAVALRDTMADDYDPTDLYVREQRVLSAQTDVIAFSADYGENGAAGWVYCPSDAPQGINARGDRWCRHQELHFNLNPRYAGYLGDDGSRAYVACHELGHTIGLRHWGNPPESEGPAAETCMQADTPDGPTNLHQIDIDHINAYPYAAPRRGRGFTERAFGDPLPKAISSWPAGGGDALEVDHYASLAQLGAAADAIVRGRIVGVELGRIFGAAAGNRLFYGAVTVSVSQLLAGSLAEREFVLELPLWGGPESLFEIEASLPDGDVILFLRHKLDGPFYRLLTQAAVVTDEDGVARVPSSEDAPLRSLDGLPFADALRSVAALSTGD